MGISPREFHKVKVRDIEDIMEIGAAAEQRTERVKKINELMGQMRF